MKMPDRLKPGDVIQLQGITGHGRTRIREHGERWKVLDRRDWGPTIPITSIPIMSCETGDTRWLHSPDTNFIVKEPDDE